MDARIYLSPPHQSGLEKKYIQEALDSNWLAPAGPNVFHFENELSNYLNCTEVVAVSSGTAALHLSLILLGVGPGDIVICQSLTFVATANPIVYQGATPVFIDSEKPTWNICPNALEDALKFYKQIGKKPKAVIGVHLYGMPCQVDAVLELCKKYEVPFIEDAAEALGSRYHGRKLGTLGLIGVVSFNGNKIITTSGGGALISNDKSLLAKARFLSSQAKDEKLHYEHSQTGYNYGLSNIAAGIGRGQLTVIEKRVGQRRSNFVFYQKAFKKIHEISFQEEPPGYFSNRWLTAILLDQKKRSVLNTIDVVKELAKKNIEARLLLKPMHLQPIFSGTRYFGGSTAENLFRTGLCLPSGSSLTNEELASVVEAITVSIKK